MHEVLDDEISTEVLFGILSADRNVKTHVEDTNDFALSVGHITVTSERDGGDRDLVLGEVERWESLVEVVISPGKTVFVDPVPVVWVVDDHLLLCGRE